MRNRWEFNFNYSFPVNVWGIYFFLEMPEMYIVYSSNAFCIITSKCIVQEMLVDVLNNMQACMYIYVSVSYNVFVHYILLFGRNIYSAFSLIIESFFVLWSAIYIKHFLTSRFFHFVLYYCYFRGMVTILVKIYSLLLNVYNASVTHFWWLTQILVSVFERYRIHKSLLCKHISGHVFV